MFMFVVRGRARPDERSWAVLGWLYACKSAFNIANERHPRSTIRSLARQVSCFQDSAPYP